MISLALTATILSSPPGLPPLDFNPSRARVWIDDGGGEIEIVAYDEEGNLDGTLVGSFAAGGLFIDASFTDGHVSAVLTFGLDPLVRRWQTDLDEDAAAERVSAMLGFVDAPAPVPEVQEAWSRRQCMLASATVAAYCGVAAAFPPASPTVIVSCVGSFVGMLCNCTRYLSLDEVC